MRDERGCVSPWGPEPYYVSRINKQREIPQRLRWPKVIRGKFDGPILETARCCESPEPVGALSMKKEKSRSNAHLFCLGISGELVAESVLSARTACLPVRAIEIERTGLFNRPTPLQYYY